jgi:hypothetical protein
MIDRAPTKPRRLEARLPDGQARATWTTHGKWI